MTPSLRSRLPRLLIVGVLSAALPGCDIVASHLRSEETSEWHKAYQLEANGRLELNNVNGKIEVEPSTGNTVDVSATKRARGSSPEAARAALERASIIEDVAAGRIKIDTRLAPASGVVLNGGNVQIEYRVKVPVGAEVKFTTVNGGIEITGLQGHITAETTNGGVITREVGGQLEASTTNGGLDIDLSRVAANGVKLEFTNGGLKMRVPRDAKATISATIANGAISAGDLGIETTENSRRRLEGRMNGGGGRIQIEGTNGGITLSGR